MRASEQRGRLIDLEGQKNFRDLGGYVAQDGRRVVSGRIYRSGELSALSDGDVERLSELGIRTVVDLRSNKEAESKGPDRLPADVSVVSITIDPGDLSPIVGPAFATGNFSTVPLDLLEQINRAYVRDCCSQLSDLLEVAAVAAGHPLIFHCTQGKDRAGICAATLLSALGVPWEAVMEDYLLSNVQRREDAESALRTLRGTAARKRGIPEEQVDLRQIRGLFFVDAEYIGAAHDEATARYGSIQRFIREGVGWQDADLARLRDVLLE